MQLLSTISLIANLPDYRQRFSFSSSLIALTLARKHVFLQIVLIIPKYKDVKLLKYFIRLYLNQYGLTLEDFYNKFESESILIQNSHESFDNFPIFIKKYQIYF